MLRVDGGRGKIVFTTEGKRVQRIMFTIQIIVGPCPNSSHWRDCMRGVEGEQVRGAGGAGCSNRLVGALREQRAKAGGELRQPLTY